jgi:hypothetical protein
LFGPVASDTTAFRVIDAMREVVETAQIVVRTDGAKPAAVVV